MTFRQAVDFTDFTYDIRSFPNVLLSWNAHTEKLQGDTGNISFP